MGKRNSHRRAPRRRACQPIRHGRLHHHEESPSGGRGSSTVNLAAPADKNFWDNQAGYQEQEDVSDAGAAQTMDDGVAQAYDAQVTAWAVAQNTPWADEQAEFVNADTTWIENVSAAETLDVSESDDAQVVWTTGVDTADLTQETDDAGAVATAASQIADADTQAATAVDGQLPGDVSTASYGTTAYDNAVVAAGQKQADGQSDQKQTLQDAVDGAYFTYLGQVADIQLNVALGTEPPENQSNDIANALSTQKQTVAGAWVNWAEKVASLQTKEVSDVGAAKVDWQTTEDSAGTSAVGTIADAAATLTGSLADAAAGLVFRTGHR